MERRTFDFGTSLEVRHMRYAVAAETYGSFRKAAQVLRVMRPHTCDWTIYKERNAIERLFNTLKHFRRVATRYDNLLANVMGFVTIAAIHILIR